MMKEEWKAIKGYEGFYEISNLGRVRSVGKNIASKLMMILGLAYEINQETKATCFVRYSGHVNYIDVEVYKNGWKYTKFNEELPVAEYNKELVEITTENLNNIIKDLQDINKELRGV